MAENWILNLKYSSAVNKQLRTWALELDQLGFQSWLPYSNVDKLLNLGILICEMRIKVVPILNNYCED